MYTVPICIVMGMLCLGLRGALSVYAQNLRTTLHERAQKDSVASIAEGPS